MAQVNLPYVDLTVLDEISPHVIAAHAAVLFSTDLSQVLWANGEGAKLIGTPTIGLAVEGSVSPNPATMRQIGMAVDKLDQAEQASAAMRVRSGFKTRLLAFTVRAIALPGKRQGVLLVSDSLHGRGHDEADMAQAAVDCLDGKSHASAVFDRQGRVLGASSRFEALEFAQEELKSLADEISKEDDRLIKRVLETSEGAMAAGIARIDNEAPVHLMILTKAGEADVESGTNSASADDPFEKPSVAAKAEANPPAPAVGAFSSKRAKSGQDGPGRWYYKQPKTEDVKEELPEPVAKTQPDEVEQIKKEAVPKDSGVAGEPENRPSDEATPLRQNEKPKTASPAQEAPKSSGGLVRTTDHTPIPASSLSTIRGNSEETKDFRQADEARPVRFVWEMDTNMVFTSVSEELANVVGSQFADIVGRSWNEVSVRYQFDGNAEITALLTKGDTWSGKTVLWPIMGADLRVPVDLAGLPTYGRDRQFAGFNGFGVVRMSDAVVDPSETGILFQGDGDEDLDSGKAIDVPPAPVGRSSISASPGLEESAKPEREPSVGQGEEKALSSDEREAFDKIAAKLAKDSVVSAKAVKAAPHPVSRPNDRDETQRRTESAPEVTIIPSAFVARKVRTPAHDVDTSILARLQIPVLVYRNDDLLFANSEFFELTGYDSLEDLAKAGGVDALFGSHVDTSISSDARILHSDGSKLNVHPNLQRVPWDENRAMLLTLRRQGPDDDNDPKDEIPPAPDKGSAEKSPTKPVARLARNISIVAPPPITTKAPATVTPIRPEQTKYNPVDAPKAAPKKNIVRKKHVAKPPAPQPSKQKVEIEKKRSSSFADLSQVDLQGILDTAADGVVVLNADGCVEAFNRSAEALFDCDSNKARGEHFSEYLAPESRQAANDYLAELNGSSVASLMNDGREVIGKTARGGLIPLFMTTGRLETSNLRCAILKDITQWKKAEEELLSAKQVAEDANVQKSEFLAKISHEVRTPLNAIIGFSDIMIDERFGAVGNDRYRGYIRDIHRSGNHVLDLINDLLDISKIEAGEIELSFDACDLNTIASETVALSQPQANKERIIIRTSLSSAVPQIVADQRSLKQIILNLVTNSIKFTNSGGQVIVSTAYDESGEVVLRVRDTGVGMSPEDLQKALKPFAQLEAVSDVSIEGSGLGLPLTKAMVEANRAKFHIESEPGEGTLVEIFFPQQRVLADR